MIRRIALVLSLLTCLATQATGQAGYHYRQGGPLNGIKMLDATYGALTGEGGRALFTTNGGTTWQEADVDDAYRSELRGL